MPHGDATMQTFQPENDREVLSDVKAQDSRKVESAEVDLRSQKPKSVFVNCSLDGIDITEVSQTAAFGKF